MLQRYRRHFAGPSGCTVFAHMLGLSSEACLSSVRIALDVVMRTAVKIGRRRPKNAALGARPPASEAFQHVRAILDLRAGLGHADFRS